MKLLNQLTRSLTSFAGFGFEKTWDAAVLSYQNDRPKDTITGPWTGTWKTDTNGHEGNIRCIVSRSNTDGNYDFHYHATWLKVIRGAYPVSYKVITTQSGATVEGTEDLGWFGQFHHQGKIGADRFLAKYSNQKDDIGSFEMKRP